MKTLDIDRKFDPSPEENRAAIEAIKAAISNKAASLFGAKVIDYPIGNAVLVEVSAKMNEAETYRIIVATISKNFIGEERANELAAFLAGIIDTKAKS